MSTKKENETQTGVDNLNDTLTGIEQTVEKNQKLIM